MGLIYQSGVGMCADLSVGIVVRKGARVIYENCEYGQSQRTTQRVLINMAV